MITSLSGEGSRPFRATAQLETFLSQSSRHFTPKLKNFLSETELQTFPNQISRLFRTSARDLPERTSRRFRAKARDICEIKPETCLNRSSRLFRAKARGNLARHVRAWLWRLRLHCSRAFTRVSMFSQRLAYNGELTSKFGFLYR